MSNHLDQFESGAVALISDKAYHQYFEGQDEVGRAPDSNDLNGSMFVTTPEALNEEIENSNGDISKLENSLGLKEGDLGDYPPVIVQINNPEEHGLRMANGNEAGANLFYNTPLDENGNLPNIQFSDENNNIVDIDNTSKEELDKLHGKYWDNHGNYHEPDSTGYQGYTSGGKPEAVIDKVPNTPENVSYTKVEGMKRGESSDISFTPIEDGNCESFNSEKDVDFNCLYNNIDKEEPTFEKPKSNGMEM